MFYNGLGFGLVWTLDQVEEIVARCGIVAFLILCFIGTLPRHEFFRALATSFGLSVMLSSIWDSFGKDLEGLQPFSWLSVIAGIPSNIAGNGIYLAVLWLVALMLVNVVRFGLQWAIRRLPRCRS